MTLWALKKRRERILVAISLLLLLHPASGYRLSSIVQKALLFTDTIQCAC
jgi:hypothetical protein